MNLDQAWRRAACAAAGFWLACGPASFGTGGAAGWNDLLCGLVIVALAGMGVHPRLRTACRRASCLMGIWLQFAPLVLWAPAAATVEETVSGVLVIGFCGLGAAEGAGEKPAGWRGNPSAWTSRSLVMAAALAGWMISRMLAGYEMGYTFTAWDPIFQNGTRAVLTSPLSKAFPVPDAGLGAAAYTLEFLLAWRGGAARWRTEPWSSAAFFIVALPLGLASLTLLLLQPLVVHAWCSLCLASAACSLLVILPLAGAEALASLQWLLEVRRQGKPLLRAFWGS